MIPTKEERVSATGFWIVGVVPDGAIAGIRRDFPRLPAVGCLTSNFPAELAWWRAQSGSEEFFDHTGPYGPGPTSAALRLRDFIDSSRADSDAVEEVKDVVMDLLPKQEGKELFCASARQGDPAAALAYALGPDHDAAELLDGPLRVLRHAAHNGHAVAGLTRWY